MTASAWVNEMVELRRSIHQQPELAWNEVDTAKTILAWLDRHGIQARTDIGGGGVVVDIPGVDPEAPVVAIRADMDALPIQERTGLPFASQRDGVMHACGHDGHSAMLCGAAVLLNQWSLEGRLPGTIRLIWQPAEETGSGAQAMVQAGVLDGVKAIFGGHIDRQASLGVMWIGPGAVNASCDNIDIQVVGRQAHGARPHLGVDAVLVASQLVVAFQSVVARELPPGDPAVVSIGVVRAGDARNVLAGQATLQGTIRTMDEGVRSALHRSLVRVAEGVGEASGAKVEVSIEKGTPAVINSPTATALACEVARCVEGVETVEPMPHANLGGEDFACYLDDVPGCYVRFGACSPSLQQCGPAHSATFDFDERVLVMGAKWFAQVAQEASSPQRSFG
jgi:hippurate hydrolase